MPPNSYPRTYWCWDILNPNHQVRHSTLFQKLYTSKQSSESRSLWGQATSFFVRPVWLLVLRCTYLLYFAATLLVYRFADRACVFLSCCVGLLHLPVAKALGFLANSIVRQHSVFCSRKH